MKYKHKVVFKTAFDQRKLNNHLDTHRCTTDYHMQSPIDKVLEETALTTRIIRQLNSQDKRSLRMVSNAWRNAVDKSVRIAAVTPPWALDLYTSRYHQFLLHRWSSTLISLSILNESTPASVITDLCRIEWPSLRILKVAFYFPVEMLMNEALSVAHATFFIAGGWRNISILSIQCGCHVSWMRQVLVNLPWELKQLTLITTLHEGAIPASMQGALISRFYRDWAAISPCFSVQQLTLQISLTDSDIDILSQGRFVLVFDLDLTSLWIDHSGIGRLVSGFPNLNKLAIGRNNILDGVRNNLTRFTKQLSTVKRFVCLPSIQLPRQGLNLPSAYNLLMTGSWANNLEHLSIGIHLAYMNTAASAAYEDAFKQLMTQHTFKLLKKLALIRFGISNACIDILTAKPWPSLIDLYIDENPFCSLHFVRMFDPTVMPELTTLSMSMAHYGGGRHMFADELYEDEDETRVRELFDEKMYLYSRRIDLKRGADAIKLAVVDGTTCAAVAS